MEACVCLYTNFCRQNNYSKKVLPYQSQPWRPLKLHSLLIRFDTNIYYCLNIKTEKFHEKRSLRVCSSLATITRYLATESYKIFFDMLLPIKHDNRDIALLFFTINSKSKFLIIKLRKCLNYSYNQMIKGYNISSDS